MKAKLAFIKGIPFSIDAERGRYALPYSKKELAYIVHCKSVHAGHVHHISEGVTRHSSMRALEMIVFKSRNAAIVFLACTGFLSTVTTLTASAAPFARTEASGTTVRVASDKELLNGLMFGVGPLAESIPALRNHSMTEKSLKTDEERALMRKTSDLLAAEMERLSPGFSASFGTEIRSKDYVRIDAALRRAGFLVEDASKAFQDRSASRECGVAVVCAAVVALAVHNVVALNASVAVSVAAYVALALNTYVGTDPSDQMRLKRELIVADVVEYLATPAL
jgi:SdpC family antimicrobial peptide